MLDPFESGLPRLPGVYDNFQRVTSEKKTYGAHVIKIRVFCSEPQCSMLLSINLYKIIYNKCHIQYL